MALGDPGQPVGSAVEPDSTQLCGLERVALPLWSDRGVISRASWQCEPQGGRSAARPVAGDRGRSLPCPAGAHPELPKGEEEPHCQGCKPQRLSCFYGNRAARSTSFAEDRELQADLRWGWWGRGAGRS